MDAEGILNKLKEDGKITEEDIREADMNYMNIDRQRIVEVFHSIFCRLNHDTEECLWYSEEQMDSAWSRDSHAKWTNAAINIITDLQVSWNILESILVAVESVSIAADWTSDDSLLIICSITKSFAKHIPTADLSPS